MDSFEYGFHANLAKGSPMTAYRNIAALVAVMVLSTSMPISAQVSQNTSVSTSNGMKDGVATQTTRVLHVNKFKTHHAKRILGVKVGHKTRTIKQLRTTTVDSNGNANTSEKISH